MVLGVRVQFTTCQGVVTLAGEQTILGNKTFTENDNNFEGELLAKNIFTINPDNSNQTVTGFANYTIEDTSTDKTIVNKEYLIAKIGDVIR